MPNPRGKLNSTNSEPSRGSNGSKTTKAEKLAYFRANVTSADDEGIVFDTLTKSGQNGGSLTNPDECDSSETEGEDLISEIEELSKHVVVCHAERSITGKHLTIYIIYDFIQRQW